MKRLLTSGALTVLLCSFTNQVSAQSLGNAGTIEGTVTDPSGAVVGKAEITVHNVVTGYMQMTTSGANGAFRLGNLPPNPYHLEVKAAGFSSFSQDIDIRNAISTIIGTDDGVN
jgi:hypothetical protein